MLRPRTNGLIGFDLGGNSVKAAQVARRGGEFVIRAAAIAPRQMSWSPAPLASEPPRTSVDELRAALSVGERFTRADAAALAPIALCEIVQVDASLAQKRGPAGLLKAAEAETQRPLDQYVLDWRHSSLKADRLTVVAAPKAWSDQIAADVAATGRHCRAIDALPWALARAVVLAAPETRRQSVVAFDWGRTCATACLVHRGAPVWVRQLKDCSYDSVVRSVEAALRLEARAAELALESVGLESVEGSGRPGGNLENLLAEPLAQLERELKRTVQFWRSQARDAAPTAVWLFGAGASLAGVAPRVARWLDVPTSVWSLPCEPGLDRDRVPPAHLIGAALGLSALAWES